MNIDDVIKVDIPKDENLIKLIFERQKELMEKYDPIERRNGIVVPEPPYNLNSAQVQYRLKDLFWRTTEEVAEAFEVMDQDIIWNCMLLGWEKKAEVRHFFEEIIDSLHFLVEASIIAGLSWERVYYILSTHLPKETNPDEDDGEDKGDDEIHIVMEFFRFIKSLGLSANCLKNKPWKMTQMMTDTKNFISNFETSWTHFAEGFKLIGGSIDFLYVLYVKKNEVNKFRQRSNY